MSPQPHALVIADGRVVTPDGLTDGTVRTEGTSIVSVGGPQPPSASAATGEDRRTARQVLQVDATGLVVAPGLIDLQINGGFGLDLATDPEAVWELGRRLPEVGVTGFCPTIISSPPSIVDRMLAALCEQPADYVGAAPLGAHLEGPMLNPTRNGAHQQIHLRSPDPSIYQGWSAEAGVAIVTMAPELPGATAAIAALAEAGVLLSGGHSDATATEAEAAAEAGMSMVTHLFNAMAPIGHRSPNLAGFALSDGGISAGVIVDGVHVDPLMVNVAWQTKGPNRFVLVSDAVAAMGLGPGEHRLGGRTVVADHNSVRTTDGTLAGTNLTLEMAVRNLLEFTDADLPAALTAASGTPARLLGKHDRGSIVLDGRADVVLLDDALRVVLTVCAGQTVYVAPDHRWRVTSDST